MCHGERNELVCRKKNQSKGRVKTNAKANLPPPRQANSCARKWNIFAKANMVHVPHSKRLPSVCQRRAELEKSCPHRSGARSERNAKPSAISPRAAKAAAKGLHARGPAPPKLRSNARGAGRHRKRRYHDKRNGLQLGVQRVHGRRPQRKPPVHANVVAEMDAAVCGARGFYA